ncbi:c-type cytochrome [Azospirillum halopraeferens]|uniref:c-type cytochrome n=1 Tax=Azospirillum halopraeferens TaxID=34010 RepID=UPI00040D91C8|nr:cytochrome c [Azospirillum halopraeferens]
MLPRITLTAAALLIAGAMGTALADGDIVKTRKDGFEANKKAMGAVKTILEKGEGLAAVGEHARMMTSFAATIPTLFPAGSESGDTDARPAVWTNFDDFTARAKAFETAAKALEDAAAAGDKAAVGKQFAAVGASCKACHQDYKKD